MSEIAQCDYYGDDVSTLGERICVARERAGLSQQGLAEALAVRKGTLSNWENDSSEPRSNRITMLAGILGVSAGWLLFGMGEGVPAPGDGTDTADAVDDDNLTERLLAELRDARDMQGKIANRMSRIEDALVALRAA